MRDNDVVTPDEKATWIHVQKKSSKMDKPSLVKVGRNAMTRALERLANLADEKPNHIGVPWERVKRPKIQTEAWRESTLRTFNIVELIATQNYLKRDDVEWHIMNYDVVPEGQHAMPNIVLRSGQALIYDGHHRIASLWLMGADTVTAWTLEA